MKTPHIDGLSPIHPFVIMPGDPRRAEFIAKTFLSNIKLVNQTRNMLGFSGSYNGKDITVMSHGMGMPSMAIYAHELIHVFGAKTLVRVGSAGALRENVEIYDIVFAQNALTDSNMPKTLGVKNIALGADFELLQRAVNLAKERNLKHHVGSIFTSDVFYGNDPMFAKKWGDLGVLAVEMEAASLYLQAALANRSDMNVRALSMATISDSLVTKREISAKDREDKFTQMLELALNLA
ncbi:MAG: purine-nucleoside phosphorylase [Helicobacter sp.]|nr:purine-nucleoside phosphorylase [Helicobacter sp.]